MEFAEGHAKPRNDLDCMVCWDTLNEETYIEYKISADSKWMPGMICETCVEHLRKTQYARYSELLQKSTCKAELRRLLTAGPPIPSSFDLVERRSNSSSESSVVTSIAPNIPAFTCGLHL